MISDKMNKAINDQINRELYSAYLYLSMAAHAANINLKGFENWLKVQAMEEMTHANRFYEYVNDQNGKVTLAAIDAPPANFSSPADIMKKTLDHEKFVTKNIHNLVTLAKKENDYATDTHLQWFVTEQIEEEKTASEILQMVEMAGKSGGALLMLDHQLAKRKFGGEAKN
ncbi:MAG: ferritin [Omnitrophica bacterium RIFCSPLOWO2_12_FULL_44_17]|uniref:Ferritin n=1 Tax=Candidatus Danuiimicrobium aquiferis TaxID=1801832 RepID=A0A1G1KXA5_9BACT|nr:MAG: ferritin [Omnitrophica bacterium RIFCSPHIGHO2_02_FULL_45_28]OGW89148.1 MAG: ferritin [Omnitrophica bacterium RIFCSPHIGHO2_12_FULL_44_12]OGW97527.1 MAG: ferritin [Omnitrophica bacterium RIFCSPLOWO2_12_FULL_44_17]OGX02080.1 MAG: ferritin [Omnitrophica bacterium RIFCSPLOWO2_02_FULL_44_11]